MQSQYTHSTQLNTNIFSKAAFICGLKKLVCVFGKGRKVRNFKKTDGKEKAPRGECHFRNIINEVHYPCQMI